MPKRERKSGCEPNAPQRNRIEKTLFGGAWLLTAAALSSKILGAVYRIPLTRALGAHGMGLYQSVFPMYALLITLTGGGFTAAVSKSAAEHGPDFSLMPAVRLALAVSLPVMCLAAVFCRVIAGAAGAPDAALSLAVLLPSVPISAVCAVLRGAFQGEGNMVPSSVGQLTEQTVKLIVGLSLAFSLARVSLTAAVAGCAVGVTVSEGAVLLYYVRQRNKAQRRLPQTDAEAMVAVETVDKMFYGIEVLGEVSSELVSPELAGATDSRKHISGTERQSVCARDGKKKIAWELLTMALPITLGLLVLPLCQVADSFIVVNLLMRSGMERETATSLYGAVTGPINGLVNLPAVFSVGLCAALLPKISRLLKRNENVIPTVKKVLCLSFCAGIVFCAGIALLAPFTLHILYGDSLGVPLWQVAGLLRTASAAIVFLVMMQTTSAVLQGGGKAYIPALHLFIAAVIKEILHLILLPRIGIYGFVIATDVFYASACVLDVCAMFLFLRKRRFSARETNKKKKKVQRDSR